jgi:hypothetical protein
LALFCTSYVGGISWRSAFERRRELGVDKKRSWEQWDCLTIGSEIASLKTGFKIPRDPSAALRSIIVDRRSWLVARGSRHEGSAGRRVAWTIDLEIALLTSHSWLQEKRAAASDSTGCVPRERFMARGLRESWKGGCVECRPGDGFTDNWIQGSE